MVTQPSVPHHELKSTSLFHQVYLKTSNNIDDHQWLDQISKSKNVLNKHQQTNYSNDYS